MCGNLHELRHKCRQVLTRLNDGGCSHCLKRSFLFCKAIGGGIPHLNLAIGVTLVRQWLVQVAMGKPFLRMLPRIRRVFGPMAHVRVDCHTTGANGETKGYYCGLIW